MLENILIQAVIVVLLTPVLLFWGLPFIAAAVLFHRHTPLFLTQRVRLAAACAIAALGIAPAFDAYRGPKPIWLHWLAGDTVGAGFAIASFLVTWALVWLQVRTLSHRRSAA